MDVLILVLATASCLFAIGLLKYVWKLSGQLKQLKHEKDSLERKLKILPREMTDMIEPLRLQLAAVVAGEAVPGDLIRAGRLYRDIASEDAKDKMIAEREKGLHNIVFIDVRTAREYTRGHVPGAIPIPIEELEHRFTAEIPLKAKMVFVYCATGERSRLACDFLSRQGYLNLYNMQNGLQHWNGELEGEQEVNLINIQPKTRISTIQETRQ